MRIDRMLSIVVLLLNRKSITARELAERFEVSLRTVYRDIDAINEAGIPVVSYQGKKGGYCIMEHYKLNHQLLTGQDTRAILTALKGVSHTLLDKEMQSAMEKIRSLVPKEKADEVDQQMDQLIIDIQPWGFKERIQKTIQDINQAIVKSNRVEISYANLKGESSIRTIEPMTLMFKGYNWYLFAYCLTRKEGRVFRLSRIKSMNILKEIFERRQIAFEDFTMMKPGTQPEVDLVLRFSSKVRQRVEDFFHYDQIQETANSDLMVRVSFPEDEWVYSMILSYGDFVEVVQPEHIRSIIKERAKKIISQY